MASNAENISILWRHHGKFGGYYIVCRFYYQLDLRVYKYPLSNVNIDSGNGFVQQAIAWTNVESMWLQLHVHHVSDLSQKLILLTGIDTMTWTNNHICCFLWDAVTYSSANLNVSMQTSVKQCSRRRKFYFQQKVAQWNRMRINSYTKANTLKHHYILLMVTRDAVTHTKLVAKKWNKLKNEYGSEGFRYFLTP